MQGFKFIHTADLHLDSPFKGISQMGVQMRQRLLDSTFQAFRNVVNLAIREEVDFLLIAGDLFDGADLSLRAQLFCREEFQRLTDREIQVLLVHGNHDHLGGWRADLKWPDGVFVYPAGEVESYPVLRDGEELARIYGISYPRQHVEENYVLKFQIRDHRDQAPFRIGLLHTNVGSIAGYANYAPCTLTELVQAGFDYWALGHVHSYQVLHPADPLVIYPGTPQGRHPKEIGAKGCCLVEVASDGSTQHQWLEVDHLRWLEVAVDIGELTQMEGLITALRDSLIAQEEELNGRDGIVRIELTGRGQLHSQLRRPGVVADLEEMLRVEFAGGSSSSPLLWIESIRYQTRPYLNLDELREEESLLGDFLKLTQTGQNLDKELIANLEESLASFLYDRRLKKYLTELDADTWQLLIRKSEEVGVERFGLEVEG